MAQYSINNMSLKRHTLLDISDRGREAMLVELAGSGPASARLREKYAQVLLPAQAGTRVPGIVRREEGALRPGSLPVGFSAPVAVPAGRMRVTAFTRLADIVRATSPYELLALPSSQPRNSCTSALAAAKRLAEAAGLCLGVWGSVAAELYTGLPCTHDDSDLDLLVKVAPRDVLAEFLKMIVAIESDFGLRIDVELDLSSGYGVQLKELFGQGRTVLGKGLSDVVLLPREQLLAELPQEPADNS